MFLLVHLLLDLRPGLLDVVGLDHELRLHLLHRDRWTGRPLASRHPMDAFVHCYHVQQDGHVRVLSR